MPRRELRFPGEKPRKPRVAKTGLQLNFEERSRSIYSGMKGRFGDKKKDGKVIKAGRELPFTLAEFRAWLLSQFNGNTDTRVKCSYCRLMLTIGDIVVDHRIPVSAPWNGSLDLTNLCLSCEADNVRKGRMSEEGFKAFIAWATSSRVVDGAIQPHIDSRDFDDMMHRMANGSMALRMRLELMEARKAIAALRARLSGAPPKAPKPKKLF